MKTTSKIRHPKERILSLSEKNSHQFKKVKNLIFHGLSRSFLLQSIALIALVGLFFPSVLDARQQNIKFENISIEQGLSQSTGNCILQDSKGFIWFGTEDGLNKYDGYSFVVYNDITQDPTSLSDDYVLSIYEDRAGVIWVGTYSGGLNRFDREKEEFTHYMHDPDSPESLSHNCVLSIYEDSSGILWIGTRRGLDKFNRKNGQFEHFVPHSNDSNSLNQNYVNTIWEDKTGALWIGTDGGGLNRLDRDKGKFIHFCHDPDNPESLSDNVVSAIFEDKDGALWIGTDNGLDRFDREKKAFLHFRNDPTNPNSLSNNYVKSIFEDSTSVLWVGTYGGGLNRFDREKGEFQHWVNDPGNPDSLSSNFILLICEDRTGVIWVGTFGGGFDRFSREKEKFLSYNHNPQNPYSLNKGDVFSLYEDRSGVLWIGTYGGGLNRFDRKSGKFQHWVNEPGDPNSLSNNFVRSIIEDSEGMLWIGTYDGLNKFDREKRKFTCYHHDPENLNSLSANYVRSVYEDSKGVLWIGTFGGGLNRLDKKTGEFTHYIHDSEKPNSLYSDRVAAILEDHAGMLWIGTSEGLNKFDREKEEFTQFKHDPSDPYSLSNDRVSFLYEDSTGILCVGTYGGGLNRFDQKEGKFIHYTKEDGLPNNVIYGILEDDQGYLWLSTNKGISKFNPGTDEFRNYDVRDGLQSNEFNTGACYKSKSGEMFFGGVNGFNVFHPEHIKDNPYVPPVVITDFQIFNKSVPISKGEDEHSILSKSILETKEIELSYKDRIFSFQFAALHYVSPEKNKYAYMMEGFEKDWNYVGNRRFATYTNLPPGNYVFRVKGSNNDGVWNDEGVSLRIKITPPFWQTWWFRGFVGIAILFLIITIFNVRTHTIRERAKQLEKRVEERTNELRAANEELQQEINVRKKTEAALKERERQIKASLKEKEVLLKEIHHRVKNNMQIISSLLRLQSRQIEDEEIVDMFTQSQNRIKSMALIHEELYQSKDLANIDFSDYIKRLTNHLFSAYRVGKDPIDFKVDVKDVYLDINKAIPCGLIISEIASNSLKHAFPDGKGGEIIVWMRSNKNGKYKLTMKDTGTGFPEGLDMHNTETLGMQLILDLVQQIEGTVELKKEKGTEFNIVF